ncbi:hypothetical protein DFH07DRAFT_777798 [Mycena maculata]|uniref:Uncharacterized protein n=1 Tax=Mycena maculata TaxID=230809 RepID=A0AAD7II80_9AGAR|nr:hypothetical protein DFH07DRAFT_777798 [Mycena maculata]
MTDTPSKIPSNALVAKDDALPVILTWHITITLQMIIWVGTQISMPTRLEVSCEGISISRNVMTKSETVKCDERWYRGSEQGRGRTENIKQGETCFLWHRAAIQAKIVVSVYLFYRDEKLAARAQVTHRQNRFTLCDPTLNTLNPVAKGLNGVQNWLDVCDNNSRPGYGRNKGGMPG